jgi:hypothetical protein
VSRLWRREDLPKTPNLVLGRSEEREKGTREGEGNNARRVRVRKKKKKPEKGAGFIGYEVRFQVRDDHIFRLLLLKTRRGQNKPRQCLLLKDAQTCSTLTFLT